jgi:hypothetical protein
VILQRKFQQASDVYALGTVFWEILSGLLPFDGEFPGHIRMKIVSGYTHPIPAQYAGSPLALLIALCWSFDPKLRPTCAEIAATIESLLDQQCYGLIENIDPIPDTTVLRTFYDQHYRKSVYGDAQLHKFLFADLQGPSVLQYLNPLNWLRYFQYTRSQQRQYRGFSVDDDSSSDGEGTGTDIGMGNDYYDTAHSTLSDYEDEDDGGEDDAALLVAATANSSIRVDPTSSTRRQQQQQQQQKGAAEASSLPGTSRQLFDAEEGLLGLEPRPSDVMSASMKSHSSYVLSDGEHGGLHSMRAQLPRAALDLIGVIKVR